MNNKWNIGAKIWFTFYIMTQWLMFIEFATKPITATNTLYQRWTLIYGIVGAVGTALILWLAIGHKKIALYILLAIAALGAAGNLFQGNVESAILGLILPGINYLVSRNRVR